MKLLKYLILIILFASATTMFAQKKGEIRPYEGTDEHLYTPLPTTKTPTQEATKKTKPNNRLQQNAQPQFPGGEEAKQQFIRKNLNANVSDDAEFTGGQVSLAFKVNYNGQISNIKILTSLGYAYDKEAVRLIKLMPRWIPARVNGQNVEMEYNMGITFVGANGQQSDSNDGIYTPAGRVNSISPQLGLASPKTTMLDEIIATNIQVEQPTETSKPTEPTEPSKPIVADDKPASAAHFKGGEDSMWNFIDNNIDPTLNDDSGNVIVSFVVQADGTISDAKIVKGYKYVYDREALRLVNSMPQWVPAERNGTQLASEYILEIPF